MAKGPESVLWSWFKSGLPQVGRPYHVERIENSVGSGRPDVEGCVGGVIVNIELKVAHHIRKDGTFSLPHLTNTQAYWHHRRSEAGGISWFLIRAGDGAHREHYLVHGSRALVLYENREMLDPAWLRGISSCDPDARCVDLWNVASSRHFVL